MDQNSGYKFGIRSLLVLTTGVAIFLAVVRQLHLPVFFYVAILLYFLFFFGWAVVSTPRLLNDWKNIWHGVEISKSGGKK